MFNKKKVAERKEWLENYRPGTHVDHKITKLPYEDFINKEFILYSLADCVRSIPSIMDGFKPGHRKILFACFKRNLKSEIKVAQLAGYVAEHSAYHHGEQSLQTTIVGMAQSFVGKNNINLLYPSGMFGTRLQGGKDAASARYIYTRLCKVTRAIFHPDDDPLLEYLDEDGQSIEPKYYAPVIPMVRAADSSRQATLTTHSFIHRFLSTARKALARAGPLPFRCMTRASSSTTSAA